MKRSIPFVLAVMAMLRTTCGWAAIVTTTADSGPGSLRQAIASAAPGETITFAVSGLIALTSGELLIDKDLTILGPGSGTLTIQRSLEPATADFRILYVLHGVITISGLTMSNGRSDYGGGMLCEFSATVLMQDVILSGNSATMAGGGLYNNGLMSLEDSAFFGNFVQAIDGNGGYGGGLFNWSSIVWLDRCRFQGNSATGDSGGGGFGGAINNSGTIVSMDGCVLEGNWATGSTGSGNGFGGGLNNDFGTATLTNCTVRSNSATGGAGSGVGFGGGLNNEFGTVYLFSSTVRGNVVRGGSGTEGGLAEGGGIGNGFGTVTLDRSTVSGNFAVGGDGGSGGPGEGGGVVNDSGTVYVFNSTVSGNVASGGTGAAGVGSPYGGGIFNGFGSLIVTHSTIAANVVPAGFLEDGGGIFNFEGAVLLKNTIVAANTAAVDLVNGEFGDIFSDGFNLAGSTSGTIVAGPGDQFNLTAAALRLGPLQNNGGPTFTHALLCGSPAIDAGDNTDAPLTDQRGFARIVGGVIDIGAYEYSNAAPTVLCPGSTNLAANSSTGILATVAAQVADANGDPLTVVWMVDGTSYQTNQVTAGGPPTTALVDFTAIFSVGSHLVTVSVSDRSECQAACSTTVAVHAGNGDLIVTKECILPAPPLTPFDCSGMKPINTLMVKWNGGTSPVYVKAWNGSVDRGTPSLLGPVATGEKLTFTRSGTFPNDVYFEIFTDPARTVKLGTSTFHLSCSDADMDGPEDCGKAAGDGKGQAGFLNDWIFEALAGNGKVLECSPAPPTPTTSCTVTQAPMASCKTVGKPVSLTFRYTGGGCGAGNNPQGGKARCSGSINPALPVSLSSSGGYTISPSTVSPGEDFTVSGRFKADSHFTLNNNGGSELLAIHTSCSQPLEVGDVFGSLTLVAFNGQTGGSPVTYRYMVFNNGSTPLDNVFLTDDMLGAIAGPFGLNAGETKTFDVPVQISDTVTNTATVTVGQNQATSGPVVVTVIPPFVPFDCSGAKPINTLKVKWNGATSPIYVKAWNGSIGSGTPATFGPIATGETLTFTRSGTFPNDVYFEIFTSPDLLAASKLGVSTFHLSCSDADMDGPEDCGKVAGDGKAKAGFINDWILAGMAGNGKVLGCPP